MSEGETRDVLVEGLKRLEAAQLETNASLSRTNAALSDVLETLKHMASIELALRVAQEQLVERVDGLTDRVDRVADRVDRLSDAILRGLTGRDQQLLELRERVERLERRLGPSERG